jgi:hypothetical protein
MTGTNPMRPMQPRSGNMPIDLPPGADPFGNRPQGVPPLAQGAPVPGSATMTGKALGIGGHPGPFMPVGGIPMPMDWFRQRPLFNPLETLGKPAAPARQNASPNAAFNRDRGGGSMRDRDRSSNRDGRGAPSRGGEGRDRSNFRH